ncbi:hypothetical protein FRC07_011476, partial [Ceratobasidium sp. 392]
MTVNTIMRTLMNTLMSMTVDTFMSTLMNTLMSTLMNTLMSTLMNTLMNMLMNTLMNTLMNMPVVSLIVTPKHGASAIIIIYRIIWVAAAKPGDKVTISWKSGQNKNWGHSLGPIMAYLAQVPAGQTADKFDTKTAKFFKVDQTGQTGGAGSGWVQASI